MANKNTKRSQNTCPQCGAPLNRNSFVLECPYCGYVDVGDIETGRYDNEADEGRFYKYVEKQWPYITQVSHAKASQQGEAFSIQSEHPYFANNGEYQLIPDFSLRLSATIHSTKLNLSMEASSDRGLPTNPYLCIVADNDKIVLTKDRRGSGKCIFRLPYVDFERMCKASDLQIVTNCSAHHLVCDELLVYYRRFYHIAFDRTQYAYSLFKRLLTD